MKTKRMMTCAAKSKLKDAPKSLRPEPQSVNFATMTLSDVRNEAYKEARGSAGFSSLVPPNKKNKNGAGEENCAVFVRKRTTKRTKGV